MNEPQKQPVTQQLIEPKKEMPTIWQLLDRKDTKDKFKQVLGSTMTPDKMLRLCINAVRKTPRLADCDPYSVFGAMMSAAALGLEPNTPLGHAFLIPYKKRRKVGNQWVDGYECQFQIGYKGFVALAHRSPKLVKLEAEAIHEADIFDNEQGSESFLKFRKSLENRGKLRGAYCYIKTRGEFGDGDAVAILPLSEIHKIRAKSETYRTLTRAVEQAANEADKQKAQIKLDETPWVMWEDDMAAKSALKKLCKQYPLSPQMVAAARMDEMSDEGTLDLSALADPEAAIAVSEGETEPAALEHSDEPPVAIVQAAAKEDEKVAIIKTADEVPAALRKMAAAEKESVTENKKTAPGKPPVEFN